MQHTYLEVRTKPWNHGRTVHRENADGLNKRGIEARWQVLEAAYPAEQFHLATTITSEVLPDITAPTNGAGA